MTKKFCDNCGKMALQDGTTCQLIVPLGAPYSKTRCEGVSVVDGTWQCKLRLFASFTMDQAEDGRKEPDLCSQCRLIFLNQLVARYSTEEAR